MHGIFIFDSGRLAPPLDEQPMGLYWIADRPLWQMIVGAWGTALKSAAIWVPDAAGLDFQAQLVQFPLPNHIEVRLYRYSAQLDHFPSALLREKEDTIPDGPLVVATDEAVVLPPKRFDGRLDVTCGRFGRSALYFASSQLFIDRLPQVDHPMTDWMTPFGAHETLSVDKELPLIPAAGEPTTHNELFFRANHQLLTIGYCSNDALERSYAEEFAVIPPVYIAPDAEIYTSVIGPYAAIGPRSRVENAIIRQSIIDRDSVIQDMLLDSSFIAADSQIQGSFSHLQTQPGSGIATGHQVDSPQNKPDSSNEPL